MNLNTIKKIGLGICSLILLVGGLMFVASFSVLALQSWPKALLEARYFPIGQALWAFGILQTPRRFKQAVTMACLVLMFVAFLGYTWVLACPSPSQLALFYWGTATYSSVGGFIFAGLVRNLFPPTPIKPPAKPPVEPWRN